MTSLLYTKSREFLFLPWLVFHSRLVAACMKYPSRKPMTESMIYFCIGFGPFTCAHLSEKFTKSSVFSVVRTHFAGVHWLSPTLQPNMNRTFLPVICQLLTEVKDSTVTDRHGGTRNGHDCTACSTALTASQNKSLRIISIYYN